MIVTGCSYFYGTVIMRVHPVHLMNRPTDSTPGGHQLSMSATKNDQLCWSTVLAFNVGLPLYH